MSARWGIKAVPLHVLSVAIYVGWLLWYAFGLPLWINIVYVGIGEAFAEIGLGVPLMVGIRRRLFK